MMHFSRQTRQKKRESRSLAAELLDQHAPEPIVEQISSDAAKDVSCQVNFLQEKNAQQVEKLQRRVKLQQKVIARLKMKMKRKPEARKAVRKELLKIRPKSEVNFLLGATKLPGHWTEEQIIQALLLRSISQRAYKFIRDQKLFPLPALSTLRLWIKDFKCDPGPLWDSLRGKN